MKKKLILFTTYTLVLSFCLGIAWHGSNAVTVMVENAPLENRTCVVIDAGHGGVDGGATSCTGVLESKFNLDIALRLNDMMHFLGYKTLMIRTTDISVYTEGETIAAKKVSDLKNRVKTVNGTENALLVSIHQNTFSDQRYSGAQVFYGKDAQGRGLADSLQSALIEHLDPDSHRKSKPSDGIYLMQNIEKPGILIECGFLTNPEEEAKLRSKDYQQHLVCVIGTVLAHHFCSGVKNL